MPRKKKLAFDLPTDIRISMNHNADEVSIAVNGASGGLTLIGYRYSLAIVNAEAIAYQYDQIVDLGDSWRWYMDRGAQPRGPVFGLYLGASNPIGQTVRAAPLLAEIDRATSPYGSPYGKGKSCVVWNLVQWAREHGVSVNWSTEACPERTNKVKEWMVSAVVLEALAERAFKQALQAKERALEAKEAEQRAKEATGGC